MNDVSRARFTVFSTCPFQEMVPRQLHTPRAMKVQRCRFISFCVVFFHVVGLKFPCVAPRCPEACILACFEFLRASMRVHVINFVFASFLVC